MILAVDMGNTNIFVGLYQNTDLLLTYRTLTDQGKSYDEYLQIFKDFIRNNNIQIPIDGAILSSVVPSLTSVIKTVIEEIFKCKVLIVGTGVKTGLPIKMDNPNEIGADLIAVSVGAVSKYGYPTIIADLGTASKIILIDKNGNFAGGSILPGMKISARALTQFAAQLPDISLIAPKSAIGKNTPDSMNSGCVYGAACAIDGLCKKFENEIGYQCNLVLTGGYAPLIKDYIDARFNFEKNIILDGLINIFYKNEVKK
ncbi:MAG: type III pantothenate kinase [Bacilli bacterium]|nr:type III pantothenate kinase [Bacilli bacterium]